MSIALGRNSTSCDHTIERSGFVQGMACIPIYSPLGIPVEEDRSSTSSSSSIGRNSDDSSAEKSSGSGGHRDGEEEVQSARKDGAFGSLEDLEEVLPMKRGISNFYAGKSKSFTSLADAASYCSVKDIVKPENAHTRKRKNLMAYNTLWGKSRDSVLKNSVGGLSKRPTNSKSTTSLVAATSSSDSNSSGECLYANSSSPCARLPPLPPHARRSQNAVSPSSTPQQNFCQWRSFSLSDLQGVTASANNKDK